MVVEVVEIVLAREKSRPSWWWVRVERKIWVKLASRFSASIELKAPVPPVAAGAWQQCWKTNSQSSGDVMDSTCCGASLITLAGWVSTFVATATIAFCNATAKTMARNKLKTH